MDSSAVIFLLCWSAFAIAVVVGVAIFICWDREDNDD